MRGRWSIKIARRFPGGEGLDSELWSIAKQISDQIKYILDNCCNKSTDNARPRQYIIRLNERNYKNAQAEIDKITGELSGNKAEIIFESGEYEDVSLNISGFFNGSITIRPEEGNVVFKRIHSKDPVFSFKDNFGCDVKIFGFSFMGHGGAEIVEVSAKNTRVIELYDLSFNDVGKAMYFEFSKGYIHDVSFHLTDTCVKANLNSDLFAEDNSGDSTHYADIDGNSTLGIKGNAPSGDKIIGIGEVRE